MAWLRYCVLVVAIAVCSARKVISEREHEDYARLMQRGYDSFHNECEFAAADRHECGKRTYDENECHKRGCCYEICDSASCTDVPWCFLAKRMLRDECLVSYMDKDDCGYYGITEGECSIRGCCWAPSPRANDPYCFSPATEDEPAVRLVDGTLTSTSLSGRVEIQRDGVWGSVCDDDFDTLAATVVCRNLGYPYGQPIGEAHFGQGTGPILWDGFTCSGTEGSLWNCANYGTLDCGHHEDAGALCSTEGSAYSTYDQYEYRYGYNYAYGDHEDSSGEEDWDRPSEAPGRGASLGKGRSPTRKSAHPMREREPVSRRNVNDLSPKAESVLHKKKAVESPSKKNTFSELAQRFTKENEKRKSLGKKSAIKETKQASKLSEFFKKEVNIEPRPVEAKVHIQPRHGATTENKRNVSVKRVEVIETAPRSHKKHTRQSEKLVAELREEKLIK